MLNLVKKARPIIATRVEVDINARRDFLRRHFGPSLYARGESTVYAQMRTQYADTDSAFWQFYELSNGGFYMTPERKVVRCQCSGGSFSVALSGDAAGIVATLTVLGVLAFYADGGDGQRLTKAYNSLRRFASGHPEAKEMSRLIGLVL